MKPALCASCAVCLIAACASRPQPEAPMTTETLSPSPVTRGHLPVNGLQMYYEVHGAGGGAPLVLLHGGGSTIETTHGRILPWFARHRRATTAPGPAPPRT